MLGVLNIVTDVMLIALPIPVLVMVKRSLAEYVFPLDRVQGPSTDCVRDRKLQLAALFAIGLFIVVITIIRLPQNAEHSTVQVNRTTWANVELFAAAIVSNAPVLYGFYRGGRENSRSRATNTGTGPHSSRDRALASQDQPWEMHKVNHPRRTSALGSKLAARPAHVYTEIHGESSVSVEARKS